MDKPHDTTNRNPGQRANATPPTRRHITGVYELPRTPPRLCGECGGTREVQDVTGRKRLCKDCDPARNGASNGKA